jgi:hypothetical protein
MTLMNGGVGNLIGYLSTGWWFNTCTRPQGTHWQVFWGGLALAVVVILVYFLTTYRGQGPEVLRLKTKTS